MSEPTYRIQYNTDGSKTFVCLACDYVAQSYNQMEIHLAWMHGETMVAAPGPSTGMTDA